MHFLSTAPMPSRWTGLLRGSTRMRRRLGTLLAHLRRLEPPPRCAKRRRKVCTWVHHKMCSMVCLILVSHELMEMKMIGFLCGNIDPNLRLDQSQHLGVGNNKFQIRLGLSPGARPSIVVPTMASTWETLLHDIGDVRAGLAAAGTMSVRHICNN